MLKYKILRWDPVLFGNSNNQVALITIKPDEKFLTFVRANNFEVSCTIEVNGVIRQIDGIVNRSSDVPNYRPNYFAKTGYYVITLNKLWQGYPKSLGTVTFNRHG
uniref:Uncharacterized protein n=1 Tax=viral metagenome TaxID=1070528 RepID=A0A6C0LWX6_9ZZZZ